MPNQELTHVFHALSDRTRRAVLERLTRGPAAVSELARPFKMALPSFVQHLGVLEDCGLVRSKKQGRVRTYTLAPQGNGLTKFSMREEYSGPMLGMIWRSIPDLGPSFAQFANGLKRRVESGGR